MCDPITALTIGATVASAASSVVQGYSSANVARYNARQARAEGYSQELLSRDDARRQIAGQTVALANSGGDVDSGTPLLLLGESARNAALNALAIRQTGVAKGAAYDNEASGDINSGLFGAGAQLLGGAVKLAQLGTIKAPTGGGGGGGPPPLPLSGADFG